MAAVDHPPLCRRARGGAALTRTLAAVLAQGALACAPTGWDAEAWAQSRPELAGRELGHLGEATPYVVALRDELVFFWCRWRLDRPLTVSLPDAASDGERTLLWRAFEAWEDVVPGLDFVEQEHTPDLSVVFDEEGPEGARAAADCAVRTPLPPAGDALDAALVHAELRLRRREGDAWGRPIALTEAEQLGAAVHEIGHALGLQGHARRGNTALSRNVDQVRRVGRRLERGDPLVEPALAALYALPSGVVVERRRLPAGSTAGLDVLLARAGAGGRIVVRLGDRAARLRTEAAPGVEFWLKDPAQVFGNASQFGGLIERAAGRAQPTEGSSSRALDSRFAAGATSPSVFSTSDSQ